MASPSSFNVSTSSSNHADPNPVCVHASGATVATFFFANYLAHCATVKTFPGESPFELSIAILLALFFPSSGVIRAFDAILRRSRFTNANKLQRAAKAGALCMVVRGETWHPRPGDILRGKGRADEDNSKAKGSMTKTRKEISRYSTFYFESVHC